MIYIIETVLYEYSPNTAEKATYHGGDMWWHLVVSGSVIQHCFVFKLLLFLLTFVPLHSLPLNMCLELISAGMEYCQKLNQGKIKCLCYSPGSQVVPTNASESEFTPLHSDWKLVCEPCWRPGASEHTTFKSVTTSYVSHYVKPDQKLS